MSKSLETAIQVDIGLPDLNNKSGKLLFPVVCVSKKRRGKTKLLPACTLLSLPGGIARAGPAADGVRAVLFFSSSPPGLEEYDPDVQYCKTTIESDIILYTWGSLDSADRQYLLKKWADECLSAPINGIENVQNEEIRKAWQKLIKLRKDKEKLLSFIVQLSKQNELIVKGL